MAIAANIKASFLQGRRSRSPIGTQLAGGPVLVAALCVKKVHLYWLVRALGNRIGRGALVGNVWSPSPPVCSLSHLSLLPKQQPLYHQRPTPPPIPNPPRLFPYFLLPCHRPVLVSA